MNISLNLTESQHIYCVYFFSYGALYIYLKVYALSNFEIVLNSKLDKTIYQFRNHKITLKNNSCHLRWLSFSESSPSFISQTIPS